MERAPTLELNRPTQIITYVLAAFYKSVRTTTGISLVKAVFFVDKGWPVGAAIVPCILSSYSRCVRNFLVSTKKCAVFDNALVPRNLHMHCFLGIEK